jgi:predicted flap endonuclease-1-like 5' DNA nuclease
MSQPSGKLAQPNQTVQPPLQLIGGLATDSLEDAEQELTQPKSKPNGAAKTKASIPATRASSIKVPAVTPIKAAEARLVDAEMSDDDLLDRVAAHLQKTGIITFQRLRATVRRGEITISGVVASEFEKQTLLSSLKRMQLSGVRKWIDAITIVEAIPEPRESLLTQLRDVMPTKRITGWIAAVSIFAAMLFLVPWSKSSHAVETVSVSVHVNYEGHPAVGAFVTLHPIGVSQLPPNVRPSGYVQANGVVKFNTFGSLDGVPAGEYLATVQWNKLIEKDGESSPGPNIVPDRYGLPVTSGLKLEIKAKQTELPALQLTR